MGCLMPPTKEELEAAKKAKEAAGAGDEDDSGDPAPIYVTAEQVNQIVNGAINRNLPKALQTAIGGLKLEETIGAAVAKAMPKPKDDDEEDTSKKSGKGKQDDAVTRQIAEMKAQLDEATLKNAALEKARIETEQARLFDNAKVKLQGAIAGIPNVIPELTDLWVNDLAIVQKRLKIGEDGIETIRVKHTPYAGAAEVDEDLPIDQAIKALSKSTEAKRFLRAQGGQDDRNPQSGKGKLPSRVPAQQRSAGAAAEPVSEVEKADQAFQNLQALGLDSGF